MNFSDYVKSYWLACISIIAAIGIISYMAAYNLPVALIYAAILVTITIMAIITSGMVKSKLKRSVKRAASSLGIEKLKELQNFPLPFVITDSNGKILYYNNLFYASLIGDSQLESDNISEFLNNIPVNELSNLAQINAKRNGKQYAVYFEELESKKGNNFILFFADQTELKSTEKKYNDSKLSIMLLKIDNLEEIYQNFKGSESALISGELEKLAEKWASDYPCLLRKTGSGQFIVFVQEIGFKRMSADKFSLLEDFRNYKYKNKKIGITISIGVGRAEKMTDADSEASSALSMAQSRGGDQCAVKSGSEYEFFGGKSENLTKSSKAKSRIISTALSDLIKAHSDVVIMGHAYSDLDSIGAALGLYVYANYYSKPVYIALNKDKSLAKELIDYVSDYIPEKLFMNPLELAGKINKDTLLIIVDTHRPNTLESVDIYNKAKDIAVIDHHRKTVDYIDNSLLFYDVPNASSASELVVELIEYGNVTSSVPKEISEALLAGIMLDTRNFILKTSDRTFEAAAFLKKQGADTVAVKRLFADSFDTYKEKNSIIENAENYKGCAIAVADDELSNVRIASSQAADELLNIKDIKASFVLYKTGDVLNISARSLGEINVQIIMEKFAGGGHLTMAAAQIKDKSSDEIVNKLKEIIDENQSEK